MPELTDQIRGQVRERLAAMERPRLVFPGALTAWADELPPARYAVVVRMLLGGTARQWVRDRHPHTLAELEAWL
jgi:hypothetical protein